MNELPKTAKLKVVKILSILSVEICFGSFEHNKKKKNTFGIFL